MHFFNPVHKMKLLEVVRALETDAETLAAAVEVGKRMGKEVVVIKEAPGFITSRINAMIGNEAFYMLQEGIATAEDIDKAVKLGLNHPMGPFELVDLVGLDTRLHILEYLHKTSGRKIPSLPAAGAVRESRTPGPEVRARCVRVSRVGEAVNDPTPLGAHLISAMKYGSGFGKGTASAVPIRPTHDADLSLRPPTQRCHPERSRRTPAFFTTPGDASGNSLRSEEPPYPNSSRRADMYVSTLQDFAKAVGGELKITAKFPEGTVEISQFEDVNLRT